MRGWEIGNEIINYKQNIMESTKNESTTNTQSCKGGVSNRVFLVKRAKINSQDSSVVSAWRSEIEAREYIKGLSDNFYSYFVVECPFHDC